MRELLEEAHCSRLTIHLGETKMYKDLRHNYQWSSMKQDIAHFVAKCLVCQQAKAKHEQPTQFVQPHSIPKWKQEHITMHFVTRLPKTLGDNDAIWVIVDQVTKFAHFLPMKANFSMDRPVSLYVQEIVRMHEVPISMVSNSDRHFTFKFWHSFFF